MSRCVNMASPVTTLPLTDSTPSSSSAALCSLVLASTRSWARTALTSGGIGGHQVDPGRVAVATAAGGPAVDGDVWGVARPQPPLDPSAHARFEVDDVDPAEDPRVGGLAEAPPGGEPEVSEELPAPLLAV